MKRLVNLGLKQKVVGARNKFICTIIGTPVNVMIEGEVRIE